MTKRIGFFSIFAYVVGSSVGAGIFLIPASLAKYGSISLLGWLFTAMGTLLIAFSFIRLSRQSPHAGGPYAYSREVLGKFWGYQVVWNYWVSNWLSNAALAVGFAAYLSVFFPAIHSIPLYGFLASSGIIWLMTFVNLLGIYESGIIQVISTALKLIPIALILCLGVPHVDFANFSPFLGDGMAPMAAIMGASTITMWAFLGFECGTVPAQSVENADKVIPRATFWGTILVVLICIGTSALAMGMIPQDILATSASPFSLIARTLFGPYGETLMSIVVLISTLGTINAMTMLQGQLPAAAAAHGDFPRRFARLNKRQAPAFATVFSSILITAVLAMNYMDSLVNQFTALLLLSTMTALVTYLMTVIADYKKKGLKKAASLKVGIQVVLSIIYIIWAMIGAGGKSLLFESLLIGGLSLFYAVFMRYKKK